MSRPGGLASADLPDLFSDELPVLIDPLLDLPTARPARSHGLRLDAMEAIFGLIGDPAVFLGRLAGRPARNLGDGAAEDGSEGPPNHGAAPAVVLIDERAGGGPALAS